MTLGPTEEAARLRTRLGAAKEAAPPVGPLLDRDECARQLVPIAEGRRGRERAAAVAVRAALLALLAAATGLGGAAKPVLVGLAAAALPGRAGGHGSSAVALGRGHRSRGCRVSAAGARGASVQRRARSWRRSLGWKILSSG